MKDKSIESDPIGKVSLPIYLDYSATTPIDERVARVMCQHMTLKGAFGNPASSSHVFGWQAKQAVVEAAENVCRLINASPDEIIWTSGATESDNLAIKGAAHFYRHKGNHIITVRTEHKAVLDTCRALEREGFRVTYLQPQENGLLDLDEVEDAIEPDTLLVSVMHVNNEIGVIQDIAAIGEITRRHGVLLHVDAAQSAGKVPIDLAQMQVDLMSFSAHKIYGPKGIGALYVCSQPRVRLESQMHGGGHQQGMRSGTLPVHQIVAMGEAFRIAAEEMQADKERILALRNRMWDKLRDLDEVYVNGDLEQRVAGNLNVSFNFVAGESLIMAIKDIAVSSGSACSSASMEPSYVLRAIGRSDALAHSSLRFSFGRFTTEAEVDYAVRTVRSAVERLRELSPLWEMYKEGSDPREMEWAVR